MTHPHNAEEGGRVIGTHVTPLHLYTELSAALYTLNAQPGSAKSGEENGQAPGLGPWAGKELVLMNTACPVLTPDLWFGA